MLTLDSKFKIPGHANKPGRFYFGLTHLFLNGKYQNFQTHEKQNLVH